MGGAPSRETLVRHIVRDPRLEQQDAVNVASVQSASSGGDPSSSSVSSAISQQPEIILIPLIPDYFPSSASPLFQQLVHVRRETTVSYYYRDARSTATEHAVVHGPVGSDKELYNWYMSLSEQRLMETDNELIALSRAGRVVSPVPCAVAFVYNATVAAASAVSSGSVSLPSTGEAGASGSGSGKKKETVKGKQNRRGKTSTGGFSNGYMTIENTVRVPHHNMRVRIFGFVGDTRFCPPSMQPSQAAKLPMCLTIFLSKSAGGNHRAQVTLLAAHTYMKQLQDIGILHHIDTTVNGLVSGAATAQRGNSSAAAGLPQAASSPGSVAAVSTDDMDPLAGLRGRGAGAQSPHAAAADPYSDPYADPYSVDESADPYAIHHDDDDAGRHSTPQLLTNSLPRGGSNVPLDGLGCATQGAALDAAKEIILRRPVELILHRADVPALCYVRELRARMDQEVSTVHEVAGSQASAPCEATADACGSLGECPAASRNGHAAVSGVANVQVPSSAAAAAGGVALSEAPTEPPSTLKRVIQTVIKDEELRGSVDAESMGRVLLWASRFYALHFERLVGGEAAKLRQELAQRNLSENPLDGTLSLAEDEPRPPKALPAPGDVWITPHDTYVEVRTHTGGGGVDGSATSATGHPHPHHTYSLHGETENWRTVRAGTVLRYSSLPAKGVQKVQQHAVAAEGTNVAGHGVWQVSPNEFAEDLLLSLCRNACHASRRAPPADEHWLLNRETGLPEGLAAGLLIWREMSAGQMVYYGTTPEFLKLWMQSGAEVESAYRNQTKKTQAGGAAGISNDEEGRASPAASKGAAAAGSEQGKDMSSGVGSANGRHSTSITVAASSSATTAVSKGLHSSYDANSPANQSGVSSGPRLGSSKERGKGSGASSMALYGAHTGFVGGPDQVAEAAASGTSSTSSPTGKGPASTAGQSSAGGSSTEAKRIKARRARGDENTAPATTAAIPTGIVAAPAEASTPVSRSSAIRSGSLGLYQGDGAARLGSSLPAHQRSQFAVPVASSGSLVRTPNSSTSSLSSSGSHSYSNLGYVDHLGSLQGSSGSLLRHTPGPFAHAQQQQQPDYAAAGNLASACWIGPPDATSHDGRNTPTVNVVVKQRRSVRLTPGTSLLDNATLSTSASRVAPSQPSHHHQHQHSHQSAGGVGSYTRAQTRSDVPNLTLGNGASSALSVRGGTAAAAAAPPVVAGSLPINILGSRDSSSDDGSFRMGGHSPSSQEQSRSLLRGDSALLSHSFSRGAQEGAAPRQHSSAMAVHPGQGANFVGTPLEDASSLKWTTTNAAQPSSMRGASVTFASGSARHSSLLHSSRYQEPCQPVLSRPASLSNSELLASSVSSTGSFSRKKEAMRPPPLFSDVAGDAMKPAGETAIKPAVVARTTQSAGAESQVNAHGLAPAKPPSSQMIATVPVAVTGSDGGGADEYQVRHSRSSSGAHTPRQENLSGSAKSSVGSGKYRWDWRGVSWTS